jgi:hypothetical protein
MAFNTTFNNISVLSWQSILLMEETRIPGENHRPVASQVTGCTQYNIMWYWILSVTWLATGRWFSPGILVSSINKIDCHDKTEILLKVVLNAINLTSHFHIFILWGILCDEISQKINFIFNLDFYSVFYNSKITKKYMPPPLPYFKVNICPLPLPHFASIFFAYLWSFRWPNYIVTLPRYLSFRLPHLDIPTGQ